MFRIAAYSDIGPRKQSNQDSCLAVVAQTPFGETAMLAVCDGVGGLSSGEVASGTVVGWLANWFETQYPRHLATCERSIDTLFAGVQEEWAQGLYGLNDRLRNYGRDNDTQLGTTCTAVLLVGGYYIIVHVGDTRVYRFSKGSANVLTIDQTWVAQEVARGNIPPEDARRHPKRNIILQSVGTQSELEPVFVRGSYDPGDSFMVCCDGFRNELYDEDLIDAFGNLQNATEAEMHAACERMVGVAIQRGERDNITVVVASNQQEGVPAEQPAGNDEGTSVLGSMEDDATTSLPQIDDADEETTILPLAAPAAPAPADDDEDITMLLQYDPAEEKTTDLPLTPEQAAQEAAELAFADATTTKLPQPAAPLKGGDPE